MHVELRIVATNKFDKCLGRPTRSTRDHAAVPSRGVAPTNHNRVDFNVQDTQQQVAGAVLGEFGETGGGRLWGWKE